MLDSTVAPTMFYGCCAWTLNEEHWNMIRTTYHNMCRKILGRRRRTDASTGRLEPWLAWLRESTTQAKALAKKCGAREWQESVLRMQWKWLGYVLRRKDGRWSLQVLLWEPCVLKTQARPCRRWTDTMTNFANAHLGSTTGILGLFSLAQERDKWHGLENEYVKYCTGSLGDHTM